MKKIPIQILSVTKIQSGVDFMQEVIKRTESKIYFSDDGRQFDNEKDCLDYERWCELDKKVQAYIDSGVGECMHSIAPMTDRIAALLNLYSTYENCQGEWYCYRPLDEDDINFIKAWLEFRSLYDRKQFQEGYYIHNKIENFKIDKPYIIVKLLYDIYVTSYEEISDRLHNMVENELESLNENIEIADSLHFSEKRNRLIIERNRNKKSNKEITE